MNKDYITNGMSPRDYFFREYAAWRDSWSGRNYPEFNDEHFRNIVAMGYEAVPFIINMIEKQPNHIVHALDLIIGKYAKFNGYASLKTLCNAWLSIYDKIKYQLENENKVDPDLSRDTQN